MKSVLWYDPHAPRSDGHIPQKIYGDTRTTMETQTQDHTIIRDTTANPAPLGLLGFGLTTVLLNLHNAGFYPLDSMIMGMGVFVGGIAQVIAGIQEWKKGNTFGATAFSAYGLFWRWPITWRLLSRLGQPHCRVTAFPFTVSRHVYM